MIYKQTKQKQNCKQKQSALGWFNSLTASSLQQNTFQSLTQTRPWNVPKHSIYTQAHCLICLSIASFAWFLTFHFACKWK